MIFVPLKTTCLASSPAMSPPGIEMASTTSASTGTFDTGTDSPVSIDSLTIASPERRTRSAGKVVRDASERSITSPGTRVVESSVIPTSEQVISSSYGEIRESTHILLHGKLLHRKRSETFPSFVQRSAVESINRQCLASNSKRNGSLTARVSIRVEMILTTLIIAIAKA